MTMNFYSSPTDYNSDKERPFRAFFYGQSANVKDLLMTDFKPFLGTFSVCLVAWYGLGDWVD